MNLRSQHKPLHYLLFIYKQLLRNRFATCFIVLLIFSAILLLKFSGSTIKETNFEAKTPSVQAPSNSGNKAPIFWVYHKTEQPLSHVISVFHRLGYVQGGQQDSWDVLWAHQYPYRTLPNSFWVGLKPHQRVNHFPGSGCFTYKPQLATMEFDFIPKAFQLPKQVDKFIAEVEAHPELMWVKKDNNHRRIKIITNVKRENLDGEGSFVQQFIGNPLLIDGRKFDIGVYTVITSVDPLRVYTYSNEVLVRFCSEDYKPFDKLRMKKYVVDDEYTRPSAIKSMAKLLDQKSLSNKVSLNVLLKKKGFSPNDLWTQVDLAIQKVLLKCESNLITMIKKLSISTRHFFELVRFDFVIDDKFKAWLMEVNLSPNLSSEHFSENRLMYEQVVFNTLSLVGLARPSTTALRYNGQYESVMLVDDGDIQVPLDSCLDDTCDQCSIKEECDLCSHCRTKESSFNLKMAFLEHVNRRGFARVYPPPTGTSLIEDKKSHANHMMSMWYKEKCQTEPSWCF